MVVPFGSRSVLLLFAAGFYGAVDAGPDAEAFPPCFCGLAAWVEHWAADAELYCDPALGLALAEPQVVCLRVAAVRSQSLAGRLEQRHGQLAGGYRGLGWGHGFARRGRRSQAGSRSP
jgi:hypothetical protein